jgi:hypothetical protein
VSAPAATTASEPAEEQLSDEPPTQEQPPQERTSGAKPAVVAGLVYLVLAVLVWWQVWTTHPSTTTTCGCGDAARFLWFFEWPTYALAHAHSLFYSQWLFHPTGINLLNDTSVLGLGVVLSPVTAAFGPVAAMNVALTLAPALSALAMFVLLARWVRWAPAAFVGGLAYGFSPFMLTELGLNQVNIAFLAVPPLMVLVLDELLVRQRRSPYVMGGVLALLAVAQFFVSTEVLVISGLFAVIGVAFTVGFVAVRHPGTIAPRAGHAGRGLGVAVLGAAVVLAYPLWFLLRGPAHLTGPIWSNGTISQYGNTFTSFWSAGRLNGPAPRFGGYQGPALPGLGYLGAGVVVVAVAGFIVWRHDRRLLLFGSLGVVAAVLSLGPGHGHWVPWQWVEKVPWVGDIVEIRFTVILSLCAAVMVAVTIDHTRHWLASECSSAGAMAGWLGAALAMAMLIPSLVVLWSNLPLTARAVVLPRWYAEVGARLPPGRVVLAYPLPFSGLQSSQAWQAVNQMRWAQAGGGGPAGQPGRAGTARAGFEVLADASLPLGVSPEPSSANLAAIREALAQWEVTTVVVPDQADLPLYEQGRGPAYAVGLFTAAIGRAPVYDHSAWVWAAVAHPGRAVVMSDATFAACTAGNATRAAPAGVASCVLAARR